MLRFIALALVVLLCGCATGYGPHGFTGGYSEMQLQPNVFQVRFNGNGYTSLDRARDFCLLRCSEVCLENGFTHFELLEKSSSVSRSTYKTASYSKTSFNSNSATTTTTGGDTYQVAKPGTENLIACYREVSAPPAGLFDAAFLARSIRHKYKIDN
jgi:hypothetical protein